MSRHQSFLITGASSFLGQAFSKNLSKNKNYSVFLTTRQAFNLDDTLNKKNVACLSGIDLTVEDDVDKLCSAVNDFFSSKFHVINCLGYFTGYKTIENTSIETAKRIFDSNVISLYNVANKIIPLMCKRKGGHFIGFSTHAAYQHFPKMVVFTAAKCAVECLIKGIANEYLSQGIIANTIALATLYTETELKLKPKGDFDKWLKPDDVCAFVENIILKSSNILNGNVIHLYKHSDTYFNQSYFDRIEK